MIDVVGATAPSLSAPEGNPEGNPVAILSVISTVSRLDNPFDTAETTAAVKLLLAKIVSEGPAPSGTASRIVSPTPAVATADDDVGAERGTNVEACTDRAGIVDAEGLIDDNWLPAMRLFPD
jgi:hypothetical protein